MTRADGRDSVAAAAAFARRELARMARPAGDFDAARYFRGDHRLRFYNVGTSRVRQLARDIAVSRRGLWTPDDAAAFADRLIAEPFLETKGLGIEVLARYRRDFRPKLLPILKRWLARNHAANWATTDAICGLLAGPLLLARPELRGEMRAWVRHPNMWVRRASVVALIPVVRRAAALDILYDNARTLHADGADLIQKAVGWALREAGKQDPARLERYLRENGPTIPRTTVRYAIERFSAAKRRDLLNATRAPASSVARSFQAPDRKRPAPQGTHSRARHFEGRYGR